MSGGISATSIFTAVATGIAGAVASSVLTKKASSSTPTAADVPKPEAPPQASKAPDAQAIRKAAQGAEGGPMASSATLLTGPSGVSNDMLSLGRNTLLGA